MGGRVNNNLYKLKQLFNKDYEIKLLDEEFKRVALNSFSQIYWSKTCDTLLNKLYFKQQFIERINSYEAYYKSLPKKYQEILYENLHNKVPLESLAIKYNIHIRSLFRRINRIDLALSHIN